MKPLGSGWLAVLAVANAFLAVVSESRVAAALHAAIAVACLLSSIHTMFREFRR